MKNPKYEEEPCEINYGEIFEKHLKTGHSNAHARFMQHLFGFNIRPEKQTPFYTKIGQLFKSLNCHGGFVDDSKAGTADLSATGHVAMQNEKIFLMERRYDMPVINILRQGKYQPLTPLDLVVGDIFRFQHGISFLKEAPCDMLLIEGSFQVSSYLEIFDREHQEMMDYSQTQQELPKSATRKSASSIHDVHEWVEDSRNMENLIINSKRFIPKGVRILKGSGTALCIRIGQDTI